MTRPRIAVSSCLIGEPVRFNGGHSRDRFLTGALAAFVEWVPFCPEMALGLGTPRETLRLEDSPAGPRLMTRRSRVDLTGRMTALAEDRVGGLDVDGVDGVDGYVFKAKSPTCGIHGIPRYPADGPPTGRRNRGVFAAAVIGAHPLLPVEDEGRLNDALLRESFVERIFAHARLRELFSTDWRPRDLVAFHARHKMQILAHDPVLYHQAGRIVAGAGSRPRDELARTYAATFRQALAERATPGRNVNVLHHCMGMLALDPLRRHDLLVVIDSYKAGLVPLSVPATLLRHHAHAEHADYVRDQSFFAPFPDALRLRNHVPA
ncbi:YbgA family protein [Nonomuraea angiospora]